MTRVIELNFADAVALARGFREAPEVSEEALHAARQEFLAAILHDVYRTAPRPMRPPGAPGEIISMPPRHYMDMRIAQELSGGGLADMLPEGLQPPLADIPQNALIVTGTPQAVDEFRELIQMLDVPPKQVNIEAKFVELGERVQQAIGLDWAMRNPQVEIFEQGHAPAAGTEVRYAVGNITTALGAALQESGEQNVQAANVTTLNNTPCFIRVGEVYPYWSATVSYDVWGQRTVDYEMNALYMGIELFVVPRINADDTVTMLVRPSFSGRAGEVIGPDGQILPIIDQVETEVLVRVPDGEELCIGGLRRASDAWTAEGIASRGLTRDMGDTDTLIFVRPRIIREVAPL